MPDKLPEVSNLREFGVLLLAGFAAGFVWYLFSKYVMSQVVAAGVPYQAVM